MNGNAARILRKEERGHEKKELRDQGFRFFLRLRGDRMKNKPRVLIECRQQSMTNGGRRSLSFSTSLMV